MPQKILLSLPDAMVKRLREEKRKFAYDSVQEIIKETLREKFFKNADAMANGKTKRGRPKKKINLYKVGSARKVFE
jgi:hypothetical protein